MRTDSKPEFILGSEMILDGMGALRPLPIFSEEACSFLQAASAYLMKDREAKAYPDVMTFAFWCRRASLQQMAEPYAGEMLRLGRGVVFHIAPSNVPVNFAYSMAVGLLAGNAGIVRVPSKAFPQVQMICKAMAEAQQEVPAMEPYLCLLRYGHEKELNDACSALCDVRVIWGGDRTISGIRKSPMKPRASEITFADRYSIAVIDADAYLRAEDKDRIAKDFYNDTYLTDQNACTSPRLVVWLGERTAEARQIFWERLRLIAGNQQYELSPVQAVDKLARLCLLGAEREARWRRGRDNLVMRAEVAHLDDCLSDHYGNSGFFLEYMAAELEEILPVCGEKCQTLSCYGVSAESLEHFVQEHRPRGIDRIVPIGRTMDFSLIWDGHDLVREMSRVVGVS